MKVSVHKKKYNDDFQICIHLLFNFIDVTVLKDSVDCNVMKRNLIVMQILALTEPCVKMNQALEISHAFANLDTLVKTVMSVLILVKEILVLMGLNVKVNSKVDLDVFAPLAGKARFVIKTLMIALKNHAY